MRAVFARHKDVDGGLSQTALIAALNEVEAPVLFSNDGDSKDSLFRRADTNASGYVDENEYAIAFSLRNMYSVCSNAVMHRFKLVANLPDDLEMFLADHSLSVMQLHLPHYNCSTRFIRSVPQFVAPALRAHVPIGSDQLGCLMLLTADQLDAAADASVVSMKEQLHKVQQLLLEIDQAQETLKKQNSNTKYQIRKMDVGSTDDFHKGLADRIGKCPLVRQLTFLLTAACDRLGQLGL